MPCGPYKTLTGKEVADTIGVARTKVNQALFVAPRDGGHSSFDKVALLLRAFPQETLAALADRMERLPPMTDEELDRRVRMGELKIDRNEIHPKT